MRYVEWNMAMRYVGCLGNKYLFMSFSFLVRSEVTPESTVSAATHAEEGEMVGEVRREEEVGEAGKETD